MFKNVKKLELSTGKEVQYFDMSIGFIDRMEIDSEADTLKNVILDGTELEEIEIDTLRRSDAQRLYDAIIRVSYPELYNEDGSIKEEVSDALKKKV